MGVALSCAITGRALIIDAPPASNATICPVIVRCLRDSDQSWIVATLVRGWGATTVARLGELVDAAPLPGFVAADDHKRVGLLTYAERGDGIEVVTIQSLMPGRGIGRALMDAVYDHAVEQAASRIFATNSGSCVRSSDG